EREPDIGNRRPFTHKVTRRDTDHNCRNTANGELLSDDIQIAPKTTFPKILAQHHRVWRTGVSVVAIDKSAPRNRVYRHHREIIPGYEQACYWLGCAGQLLRPANSREARWPTRLTNWRQRSAES